MIVGALVLAAALALGAPVASDEGASEASDGVAAVTTGCAVTDAALTWGFKESFRSYISGTIANGEWTVANGATYATPEFGWSAGTGTISDGVGTIDFDGSVEFTGHGGILDTTVANPRLVFDGSGTARLLLDVSGTTQQGETIDEKAVDFASIDLGTATYGDGTVTIVAARTILTEPGAVAFGTYEAGEPFDPLTVTLTADPACTKAPAVPTLLLAAVGAAVLVVVAVGAVLVVRRRRSASRAAQAPTIQAPNVQAPNVQAPGA